MSEVRRTVRTIIQERTPDGELLAEQHRLNGKLHDPSDETAASQRWGNNRSLIEEKHWRNGKPHGRDRRWTADGKLILTQMWENGKLVEKSCDLRKKGIRRMSTDHNTEDAKLSAALDRRRRWQTRNSHRLAFPDAVPPIEEWTMYRATHRPAWRLLPPSLVGFLDQFSLQENEMTGAGPEALKAAKARAVTHMRQWRNGVARWMIEPDALLGQEELRRIENLDRMALLDAVIAAYRALRDTGDSAVLTTLLLAIGAEHTGEKALDEEERVEEHV